MQRFSTQRFGQMVCLLVAIVWFGSGVLPAAESERETTKTAPEVAEVRSAADVILQKEADVRKKLKEPTSFEFIDTPLADVMKFLGDQHNVKIILDKQAKKNVDIRSDRTVVTLVLKDVSLDAGLKHLLRPSNLVYLVREDVVLITSEEVLEHELKTQVFHVRDLIQFMDSEGVVQEDPEELIELLTTTIEPSSWDMVGGPGGIEFKSGLLVIRHTSEVLESVEQVLSSLRKVPIMGSPIQRQATRLIPATEMDVRSQKILAALETPLTVEFSKTPLADVVQFFQGRSGVEILLDGPALEDEGIAEDATVTLKATDISLRAALKLALDPLNLEFFVHEEVLQITTEDVIERHPNIAIYAVEDLLELPTDAEFSDVKQELDDLSEMLVDIVEPNTWESVGGPGSLAVFQQRGALVIATTPRVHQEVEMVLAQMRKELANLPPTPASAMLQLDEVECVIYELRYQDPQINPKSGLPISPPPKHLNTEKLVTSIPLLLGDEVWGKEQQGVIQALEDRVLVKHTRRVQRKVENALVQMGVGVVARRPGKDPDNVRWGATTNGLGASVGGGSSGFFNVPGMKND